MIDKAKMIAEIVELTSVPTIDPECDLTAQELAPHLQVDVSNVPRTMGPLVEQGLYETAIKKHPTTRRHMRVWWKVE